MPAAAIPAWALITAAAVPAAASITGAALSSRASGKAVDAQTQAANHAADVQAKSAADALAYQKAQAAQDLTTANATQKANYDQWAAREGRLSNLSALTGGGKFDIPAYSPIPNASGVTPNGLPAGTGPSGNAASYTPPTPASVTPTGNASVTSMANAFQVPSPMQNTGISGMGSPSMGQDNRVVMMKAPNGQTKGVPAFQVPHYQQLGATVIG